MEQIIALAVVTEAATEYIFSDIPLFEKYIKKLSMVVGIVIALLFRADIFILLGVQTVSPVAAYVITGILISRGSNVLNNLITVVQSRSDKAKPENNAL